MNLIPQLKQEHVEIIRTFNSIKTGVSNGKSGDEELLNDLKELKNTLVAHLGLEDKLLYPALAKSKVTEAKELGEKFSDEMAEISKVALAFFGKYMSETISDLLQSSEFRKELNGIIQAVTKRIDAEEDILFPAYNKCCANK
jgi:hemerythrin-like domain-containing protein